MKTVKELALIWTQETGYLSIHSVRMKHPAFQEVISRKDEAIPELVGMLGMGWFPVLALFKILGDRAPIIPEEHHGRLSELTDHFIKWSEEHGFDNE